MSETHSSAPQANSLAHELFEPFASKAVHYFNLAHRHAQRARNEKILSALSKDQLRDAGIDRSLIHSGPEIEVDARLMSTLMSLR